MGNTIFRRPFNIELTGTPEAGKTTQFKRISEQLQNEGFDVLTIRESAEIVPSCFQKGSADAHRWMGLQTFQSLLSANASDSDIVIIDRGFVDRMIWQEIFLSDGKITQVEVDGLKLYFNNFIPKPDILFVFSIPPGLSIKRRGGEGRITTESFVSNYNSHVQNFLSDYGGRVCNVDASLSINEVSQILMDNIHQSLSKFN